MIKSVYSRFLTVAAAGIFSLIIAGCGSSSQIETSDFKGYTDVAQGEEATMKWAFNNVDRVKVKGLPGIYEAVDSAKVRPARTAKYDVVAYSGDDSLVVTWTVYVNPGGESNEGIKPDENLAADTQPTKTGPDLIKKATLTQSYVESNYLAGKLEDGDGAKPSRLKIMRVVYPEEGANLFKFRAITLDRYGNYIGGVSSETGVKWDAAIYCRGEVDNKPVYNFIEKEFSFDFPEVEVAICLDNSARAQKKLPVREQVNDFIKALGSKDKASLSYFNHKDSRLVSMTKSDKAYWEIKNAELPEPKGLNAMYKAAFVNIAELAKIPGGAAKIFVMIVFGSDNSSIIYDARDVAEIANKNNIPVYVIGIGDALETYSIKYLTSISGGRFYHIAESEIPLVKNILQEIFYAQKGYYEAPVVINPSNYKCNKIKTSLSVDLRDVILRDNYRIAFEPEIQYSKNQIVAAFEFQDTRVSYEYNVNIASLARVLKENSEYSIELIGHSSMEGSDELNEALAIGRAESVAEMLENSGVNPVQLKTRSEGAGKPIYYLQQEEWQQYYNRRVEIRWLSPEMKPYEIIAQSVETEAAAQNLVDKWEERGYKAYYERYVRNGGPIYRIRLWGYKTTPEANAEATKLRLQFSDVDFTVE